MKISTSLTKQLQIYLQERADQDEKAKDLLEILKKNRANSQDWFNWGILKLTSLLGLFYLGAITFRLIDRGVEQGDIILFTIILLFNSSLFEKLQELEIGKDGVSVKVLQEEVEAVKERVDTQKADIEAQGGAIQHLAKATDCTNRKFVENIVSEHELKHLTRLYEAEKEDKECPCQNRYTFEVELKRLRTLGLIENQPGKNISKMPKTVDLRDYVKTTQRGRDYIELRKTLGVDNSGSTSTATTRR
jgi:hypothetical protein